MQVHLLGTTFTIQTDEDPAYVKQLLGYVEKTINETGKMIHTHDPLKIAIISSLMLADELHQVRMNQSQPEESRRISQITLDLIRQIDQRLQPSNDPSL